MPELKGIIEEKTGRIFKTKTNYRGAGVKFESAALHGLTELGRQWPRKERLPHNMEEEIGQERENEKRETPKIETRVKRKKIDAMTNEVEYLIESPPPQDRPPDPNKKHTDMEQMKHAMKNEVEYPIPCPPPQDRPPDYQQSKSKTTDKEKTLEDWGRETSLLFLRYIDQPPFEPFTQYRLRKNKRTKTLFLLKHIHRPPFLEGPSQFR